MYPSSLGKISSRTRTNQSTQGARPRYQRRSTCHKQHDGRRPCIVPAEMPEPLGCVSQQALSGRGSLGPPSATAIG